MTDYPPVGDELLAERRAGGPGNLPDDMAPWMAKTITAIDRFSNWVGRLVSFLVIPIFAAMVYEIVVRYSFTAPTM